MASNLPSEIIIEICGYLHPKDLYSLASVSKNYRSLLWSETSNTTQEIWKTSRELYINHKTFPPPDGMCEQKYCWLLVIVDEYKVPEILIQCLIRIQQPAVLKTRRYLVTNVFSTLAQFYEIEGNLDVNFECVEYEENEENEENVDEERQLSKKEIWIQQKKAEVEMILRIAKKYKLQHDLVRYENRQERIERILRRCKYYKYTSTLN
ncbi:21955_t:CDS:2 [Gigaspora rosea]|nr:21955_t:CDS:2 [Gigaspora rosea]